MNFETYHAAVLRLARNADDVQQLAVGSRGTSRARKPKRVARALLDRDEARTITAAAALVIQDRGEEWCFKHPAAFQADVISYLPLVARIVLTAASLLLGGGGVWVILLRTLIPAVIDLLLSRSARPAEPTAVADEWALVASTARDVLNRG
jgi:hypothetical protein